MTLIQVGNTEEKIRGYKNQIKHFEERIRECEAEILRLNHQTTLTSSPDRQPI